MIIQAFLQFVLPALLLYELFTKRYPGKKEWLVSIATVALYLLLMIHVARVDTFSYYVVVLLPLLFVIGAISSFRRIRPNESTGPDADDASHEGGRGLPSRSPQERTSTEFIVSSIVALALLAVNVWVYAGRFPSATPVELAYPLRDGAYFVGGGGGNRLTNNHMSIPSQAYALDIVRLNAMGRTHAGFGNGQPGAYAIFGDDIYSPCDGTVAVAVDGLPDLSPPNRDETNLAGNHVVISCHGVDVLLAHMMEGSVAVEVGDTIDVGQEVGRVGNSGNTTQPHLHIHAERGGEPDVILDGRGTPMLLGGRFLVRTSRFSGN